MTGADLLVRCLEREGVEYVLADAFGCRGFRVESATELAPILKEALAHPGPAVIDCPVDYRENDRLIEE